MDKVISLIEKHPHLYEILQECPYWVLKTMSIHHFRKGEIVYRQGDYINRLYIIVQGTANIYVMSENGRKYSQAIYQKGDFIGEIEIFEREPSVSSVEALSDLILIGVDAEDFYEWISIDRHMSNHFNRSLSRYLYNLATKSGIDSLYPLKFRLCNYLIEKSKHQNGQYVVEINKKKMSEQLAVTLRSVNRVLKDLVEKNAIAIKRDTIIILDLDILMKEKEKSMHE